MAYTGIRPAGPSSPAHASGGGAGAGSVSGDTCSVGGAVAVTASSTVVPAGTEWADCVVEAG